MVILHLNMGLILPIRFIFLTHFYEASVCRALNRLSAS